MSHSALRLGGSVSTKTELRRLVSVPLGDSVSSTFAISTSCHRAPPVKGRSHLSHVATSSGTARVVVTDALPFTKVSNAPLIVSGLTTITSSPLVPSGMTNLALPHRLCGGMFILGIFTCQSTPPATLNFYSVRPSFRIAAPATLSLWQEPHPAIVHRSTDSPHGCTPCKALRRRVRR